MKTKKEVTPQKNSQAIACDAGCFSSWLRRTRQNFITEKGVRVNCGTCIACCTSAYFIHVRPEEKEAMACIDKKLLFPAPGAPKGHMLLGYFKNGHCPMQFEKKCKIYHNRPITCRNYDCRLFTATGLLAGESDKKEINNHVLAWQFRYPTEKDKFQQEAIKKATQFLSQNMKEMPSDFLVDNPTQIAIMAIQIYKVFMPITPIGYLRNQDRTVSDYIEMILKEHEKFQQRRTAYKARHQ